MKIISIFNNKGGVGKTSILWNAAVSLAEAGNNILVIDFDPQCNLSIACLGDEEFADILQVSREHQFSRTIRSFALPYIQRNQLGDIHTSAPRYPVQNGRLDIVPGDFWLNTFSDILNVGTDVISGAGLYRFLLPYTIANEAESTNGVSYDYVLIDLPPSFNTLVRSALYCSDYFFVPCTPDLFSSYCVGLIGEMLPSFIADWEQGKQRYLANNLFDEIIPGKGRPQFGGWIFNGFDTRSQFGIKKEVGADKAHLDVISNKIRDDMIPNLASIASYEAVPAFVSHEPVAKIEDLNVMAPDSIIQNIPIRHLEHAKPTRELKNRRTWAPNQVQLMNDMSDEYDKLATFILHNCR